MTLNLPSAPYHHRNPLDYNDIMSAKPTILPKIRVVSGHLEIALFIDSPPFSNKGHFNQTSELIVENVQPEYLGRLGCLEPRDKYLLDKLRLITE